MEATPLMFPIPEAARQLGIGRSLFYELLKSHQVLVVKIGRRAVVPAGELQKLADRLVAEAKVKPAN